MGQLGYYSAAMVRSGGQPGNSGGAELRGGRRQPRIASRWAALAWWQGALLMALTALAITVRAQRLRNPLPPSYDPSADPARPLPDSFSDFANPAASSASEKSCSTWTEAASHSPTVSAARLMVPNRARSEYQKACGALKDRKLEQAEQHARKALDVYASYAAAWVLLGQILEGQQKHADAREACSQAMRVDSGYVPAYLCLADFAAREQDWGQVSLLADRAQALDPISNAFIFYFTASAQFHFQQLRQAETNAEAALKLDVERRLPELHYLLAQIYQAQGDLRNEAIHLRRYLKLAPNATDSAQAKTLLAQIDAKPQK